MNAIAEVAEPWRECCEDLVGDETDLSLRPLFGMLADTDKESVLDLLARLRLSLDAVDAVRVLVSRHPARRSAMPTAR